MPSSNYTPMGAVPDFYSQLLNSAQQQLVRLPDGTLAPAPQYGQPYTLNDLYGGILPGTQSGQLMASGRSGGSTPFAGIATPTPLPPRTFAPTMAETRNEGGVMRTAGGQAGTVALPPGVRPNIPALPEGLAAINSAAPTLLPNVPDSFGYAKDQTRMAPNGGLPDLYGNAPLPAPSPLIPLPPASTPLTAVAPPLPVPRPPASTPLTQFMPPLPVPRPSPPPQAAPGPSYTVRSGDTLSELARSFGTTTAQLANANGISNANRIRAGQTLNLGFLAPPIPQQRPVALGGIGNAPTPRQNPFPMPNSSVSVGR